VFEFTPRCLQQKLLRMFLLVMTLTSMAVHAEPLPVYFGGFAFVGDFAAKEKLYPYSSAILESDAAKPSQLDRSLNAKLQGVRNATFTLELDTLGSLRPGSASAVAAAFALDRETVSVERIAGQYKVVIDLSAQALFFDFKEKSVLASFPITVQYIDVKQHAPTRQEILTTVKDLYLGSLGVNVFDEFVSALKIASFNSTVSHRIRVTEVRISDEARTVLPTALQSDETAFKIFVAQEFAKYLSKNQHVSVLPYVVDTALGKNMAMRISDGSVYNLKIPQEDYAIQLELIKFKKVEYQKAAAGKSFIYGSFLHVKANEPLGGTLYIDETIKNGATKIVPTGQDVVDDWAAYQESLLALLDKFTLQLTRLDPDWSVSQASGKSLLGSMKKFAGVIQKCK
jgi:hypothetical protein